MAPKPRALFVSAHVPSRNAPQAGHKTAFRYLAECVDRFEVDLLVCCRPKQAGLTPAQRDELTNLVRSVHIVAPSSLARATGLLRGVLTGLAPRLATRHTGPALAKFQALLAADRYELVWLEFSQSFWLLSHAPGSSRIVLSAHDLQTQLVSTKSKLECGALLGWTYRNERRFFAAASTVRVQSAKDAALLANLFQVADQKIDLAKPTLSEFVYDIRREREHVEPWSLLFWGAMGRVENADAVLRFVDVAFHRLLAKFPGAKLYIVGSEPPARVRALASARIEVTGFVDDPSKYFRKCSIGLAPLEAGAGVKVKVLEMLEAKIPVVSTRIGAEGIVEHELLTVAPLDAFADVIEADWTRRGWGDARLA